MNFPVVLHEHNINEPTPTAKHVAWHKANSNHIAVFKTQLVEKWTSLQSSFPIDFLHCLGCSSPLHISLIDKFAVKLQTALIDCSNLYIPHVLFSERRQDTIIGWNEECKELRQCSLFWYN